LDNHRYQLYNRTNTNARSEDLKTWSLRNFQDEIDSLFQTSLLNAEASKKQSLSAFDPIIIRGNTRHLRPTLYDLLAHRALEYYAAAERDVTKRIRGLRLEQPPSFFASCRICKRKIYD
jgi:hypothetical protein